MTTLPGSIGYSVFGDKSVEFYRDPKQFLVKKMKETGSRVFQSRLLNTPTVFICSSRETHELLHEKSSDFDHGYRDFLYNSYGDNILFENGEAAAYLKSCMEPIFSQHKSYEQIIERTCKSFLDSFAKRKGPINVYEDFKALMTRLCLDLFLGFSDPSSETSSTISKLATLHWHGIISMPVSIKVPFAGESGWRKALQAKEELLRHIRSTIERQKQRISDSQGAKTDSERQEQEENGHPVSFIEQLLRAPFETPSNEVEQHILLFVSALIPKAFASIITSFVLEMAGEKMADAREKALNDENFHRRTLLEVQRLWPPFLGGRRIANKDTMIGGYKIPKGFAVVYVSYFAHRDEIIFAEPHAFHPDRWLINRLNGYEDVLFSFGGGPRRCLGMKLIHNILKSVTMELLEMYSWSVEGGEERPFAYKLLPVTRPDPMPHVRFIKR